MTLILHLNQRKETQLKELALSESLTLEELAESAIDRLLESKRNSTNAVTKASSIRSLRGVGAKSPVGKDAQKYIIEMREEWDAPE